MQPIQPHLVGVALFVPESPVGCARLPAQLVVQHVCRPQVLFIPRRLVEIQQLPPIADVVQIELIQRVVANRAAFVGHERVHCVLDVIEILLFARHGVQRLHAAPRHAIVIAPAAGQQAVTLHQAIRHFRGGFRQKLLHFASSSNVCAIRTARRFFLHYHTMNAAIDKGLSGKFSSKAFAVPVLCAHTFNLCCFLCRFRKKCSKPLPL